MPPLEMVLRPFISVRVLSHPALRLSPPPPVVPAPVVVSPVVALVVVLAPPAPFPVDVPVVPPGPPKPPGPPLDDIPPPEVLPIPPTLDPVLVVVPFVPLPDDEADAVLDEPEVVLPADVVLEGPVVALLDEADVVVEPVVTSPSAGAGSPLSAAHPARYRLKHAEHANPVPSAK